MAEFWDNTGGWLKAKSEGRNHLHIQRHKGQEPECPHQACQEMVVFHRRGHHVQKAHGRRTTLAAEDSHLGGGMIALMPTEADAKRLALPGGEKAAELHCTLLYLGDDGVAWPDDVRAAMEAAAHKMAAGLTPVKANIFGVAHWNGNGEKPSWVWSVGDNPDQADGDSSLHEAHNAVGDIIGMAMSLTDGQMPEIPVQHSPWVAHICAAYTDDLTLVRTLEKRLGPVTFDRLRLSFGDDDRDIPLTGALTASAFRRDPLPHEAHTDFAEHNRQWEGAVSSALSRLSTEMLHWRQQIRTQVVSGIEKPETLSGIQLETEDAAGILSDAMHSLAERAGQALQREAEAQGAEVPEWKIPANLTAAIGGRRLISSVAQMTADLLASSMVQTAKRLTLGLLTREQNPETIAAEVDQQLQAGQEGLLKGPVGQAMSTAQTAGREAVLRAAPPATYHASEMLDKNTCGPCKAVDGEQFSSLEIAVKAYPVMGYKDCVGPRYGHSCRGMIVADWTPPEGSGPVTAAGGEQDFHGSLGDPGYHLLHPGNRGKGKEKAPGGGMIGSPDHSPEDHQEALRLYQRSSWDFNELLRHDTVPEHGNREATSKQIDRLNDLISVQEPVKEEQTVWRGTKQAFPPMSIGDEFHDRGFTSTSESKWVAESVFSDRGGGIVSIKVPPDYPRLKVASVNRNNSEEEVILPPGTRYRVTGVISAAPPRPTGYELEVIS